MKFQLAINMERITPDTDMADVERHTLETVSYTHLTLPTILLV